MDEEAMMRAGGASGISYFHHKKVQKSCYGLESIGENVTLLVFVDM